MIKLDRAALRLGVAGLAGLAVVFAAFQYYTLQANLRASAAINQKLKSDIDRLSAQTQEAQSASESRVRQITELTRELEQLRSSEAQAGKRNTELERLVADAEASLTTQNAKMAGLEARLKEAEERLRLQREKSQSLAGRARDAKAGAGSTEEYAKLIESQWLATLAQTEKMQKELEEATLALAEGNAQQGRMQREVATMHYNLAVILAGQGRFDAAIREYERVLQVRPDDSDAHYNLAVLYDTEIKDRQKALEHYRRYLSVAPDSPDAANVRLWIKEKEFETRFGHDKPSKEEKKF